MKSGILIAAIAALLVFLCGCVAAVPAGAVVRLDETVAVQENQRIAIDVNTGRVTIHGDDSDRMEIRGQIPFPEQTTYQISESAGQITLSGAYRKPWFSSPSLAPIELDISVPHGTVLQFDGFDAEVIITDFSGTAVISSAAGDIQADHLAGDISLRSGRGDVSLGHSSGELRVLGEHGTLAVFESHGAIGMSSIMGILDFKGTIHADDDVHLEVDHGPVQVQLGPASDVALAAASTSGDVACRLPQRTFTNWGCTAELGAANGRLDIRTVSGPINIQLSP
jgi:hypothetical protein